MQVTRTLKYAPALLAITLSSVEARCQLHTEWKNHEWSAVTTVEEGAITGDEFAAGGIIGDWNETLSAFNEFSREEESAPQSLNTRNTERTIKTIQGLTLRLPRMIDENGVDLFMLTRDGITIYMALDAPVFLQDVDDEIVRWVRFHAIKRKKTTAVFFQRYEKWEPLVKAVFERKGVPPELADLCLIESGCTMRALSPAGALGMWQIMPATGRRHGLVIDDTRDDRLDPSLATPAAADILKANYELTGNWTLAAASYNCGPARMKRTPQGILTWDAVKDKLPEETRHYIPSLIAMHYVWTYRKELGF